MKAPCSVVLALLVAHPVFAQRGGPAVRSPELQPDRRVTFRLVAPNATAVRYLNEVAPLLFG